LSSFTIFSNTGSWNENKRQKKYEPVLFYQVKYESFHCGKVIAI
jgi:hypothetical protein